MIQSATSRTAESRDRVDEAWSAAAIPFANLRAMRPSGHWFTGVGERTGAMRLQRLRSHKKAESLRDLLAPLSQAELRRFLTLAIVNFEQAKGAMRLNLIANISVPVGFLIIMNQIFPGHIGALIDRLSLIEFYVGFGLAVTLLLASMWYCYAGVHQARDLYHLALIAASDAGGAPIQTSADDGDPETDVSELY